MFKIDMGDIEQHGQHGANAVKKVRISAPAGAPKNRGWWAVRVSDREAARMFSAVMMENGEEVITKAQFATVVYRTWRWLSCGRLLVFSSLTHGALCVRRGRLRAAFLMMECHRAVGHKMNFAAGRYRVAQGDGTASPMPSDKAGGGDGNDDSTPGRRRSLPTKTNVTSLLHLGEANEAGAGAMSPGLTGSTAFEVRTRNRRSSLGKAIPDSQVGALDLDRRNSNVSRRSSFASQLSALISPEASPRKRTPRARSANRSRRGQRRPRSSSSNMPAAKPKRRARTPVTARKRGRGSK